MHINKLKNYLDDLDTMIRNECTGTAEEFAKKLGISDRTLRNHLQQLRDIGVEIVYDHYRRTYKYSQKGKLTFGFTPDSND